MKVVPGGKSFGVFVRYSIPNLGYRILDWSLQVKKRNQKVKLVLNAGLQKDGLSKEEETRLCGCSYNSGKIVGITGFKAFRGKLKRK